MSSLEEIFIVPILPKLSFDKLTSEFPSGKFLILNLVPFISKLIVGSCIIIDPSVFFAILPDSIIKDPILTFPKKISLKPRILNSVTSNEDDSLKITVELSLY